MTGNMTYPKGIMAWKDGRLKGAFVFHEKRYYLYQKEGETNRKFFKRFADYRYEVEHGMAEQTCRLSFDELYAKYMDHRIAEGRLKVSTLNTYDDVYRGIIKPVFGKTKINHITTAKIENFFDQMAIVYSDAKILQAWAVMNQSLEYAYKREWTGNNPMKRADRPKSRVSKEKKAIQNGREDRRGLTKEEQDLFLKYAKKSSHYILFEFALSTGLRINEITGLKWEDIDYKNHLIHVTHNYYYDRRMRERYETEPKSNRIRSVPMLGNVEPLLAKRQLDQSDQKRRGFKVADEFVFTGKTGQPIMDTAVRRSMELVVKKIRDDGYDFPDITPHWFRHTFATRGVESGVSLTALQAALGHHSITVTEGYVHKESKFVADELAKMNGAIV